MNILLNRFALIATIAGTLFGIPWAIWTYWKSQEASTPTIASHAVIRGNQNLVIQGNNNILKVPSEFSPQQNSLNPEALLDTLNTGISRTSLEAQFGPAMFDSLDSKSGFRNLIFVFPRFFLQTVITLDGKVVFYSVTTRSEEFRPEIPQLGGKLLEVRFVTFENSQHYYSHWSSKYFEYAEQIYLGNPGNYRNYYLGYCPSGAYPMWKDLVPITLESDGPASIEEFRASNVPNCYGVGGIFGDENKFLKNFGMGINYFVARDL